jgi:tRNA (cmo5U34)-methyltransferase
MAKCSLKWARAAGNLGAIARKIYQKIDQGTGGRLEQQEEQSMNDSDTLCGWGEESRVRYYVENVKVTVPRREEQLAFVLDLFPWPAETPLQVLDLGAGFGALTREVLTRFPRSRVTCVDGSGEMMKLAREQLASYGGRVNLHLGDLAYRSWQDQLAGGYDAAVSALAIHHLTDRRKREFYAEVFGLLKPGGVFINDDSVLSAQPWQARVAFLRYRYIQEREQAVRGLRRPVEEIAAEREAHSSRHQNYKAPLRDQLEWLGQAGFVSVDCFWKYLDQAIFGGVKATE